MAVANPFVRTIHFLKQAVSKAGSAHAGDTTPRIETFGVKRRVLPKRLIVRRFARHPYYELDNYRIFQG